MKLTSWQSIGLIVALTIIVVAWIARSVIRKDKEKSQSDDLILDDQKLDNEGSVSFNAKNVAVRLRELLYDATGNVFDIFTDPIDRKAREAWRIILELSDAELVEVANAYNAMYQYNASPTLSGLVHQEVTIIGNKKEVLQRLQKLKIS